MLGLVLLVGSVCMLAGIFIGVMAPHWLEPDPYDRLADRDRRRHA